MAVRYYSTAAKRAIDKHVGSRVRMRRMMLAMSQQKLADGLGLTFQQVQKYEKGTNRVGAGRLQQISHILQVSSVLLRGCAERISATRLPSKRVIDCPDRRLRLRFKWLKADRSIHAN